MKQTMKQQIIVVPITRLKPDEHMVYGFASTGQIDTFETRFDPAWWPQAVAGYMQKRTVSELHQDINGDSIADTHREPSVVGESAPQKRLFTSIQGENDENV